MKQPQNAIPSSEEKKRAIALALKPECPHCGVAISITDAISLLQGDGWERWVQVQVEDGRIIPVRIADVNPQTMRIVTS